MTSQGINLIGESILNEETKNAFNENGKQWQVECPMCFYRHSCNLSKQAIQLDKHKLLFNGGEIGVDEITKFVIEKKTNAIILQIHCKDSDDNAFFLIQQDAKPFIDGLKQVGLIEKRRARYDSSPGSFTEKVDIYLKQLENETKEEREKVIIEDTIIPHNEKGRTVLNEHKHQTLKQRKGSKSKIEKKELTTECIDLVEEEEIDLALHNDSKKPHPTISLRRITRKLSKEIDDREGVELFRYNSIAIYDVDLKRVRGDMLNDIIINFYIEFLQNELQQKQYYFCNSYFCRKLESGNFNELVRWVKEDWFQKKFIFIPQYQGDGKSGHWYLFIVCCQMYKKGEEKSKKSKEKTQSKKNDNSFEFDPCILAIDSMPQNESKIGIIKKLKSFIASLSKEGTHQVDKFVVDAPRQRNTIDCGVFMLYFIDKIARTNPTTLLELKNCLLLNEALNFREVIEDALTIASVTQ
ncbi:hypothetical protein ENUP19_0062G0020 [Entamoeba nuttalli]|uniref:Ulp1 protease family, C-terminal catalytic domain containing protein n=2 Tax=Entamoeba nuttalli TaxID=412467 RepID=K2GW37_ENTNP|nr:Ulp1 protease family, C-terminal catalytic domain containing protein [Entamoeba nuttalli P19]EKE38027.1 Ulp1 protease family, C-terminal catalytic domain containing protein [Entamoeba nuttalli P19]|eukprot:XP_008859632.1 Ulp1 protease family, C-terminal catalytic domain containing protein [Entamoeba nuttalli P19]